MSVSDFQMRHAALIGEARAIVVEKRERVREHLRAADALLDDLRELGITVEIRSGFSQRDKLDGVAILTSLDAKL